MDRLGAATRQDVAAFAARVARLDPAALVRVRPEGPGRAQLWATLPIGVLAVRGVEGDLDAAVYRAGDLRDGDLATAAARPESEWRGLLPSGPGEPIETLAADEIARMDRMAGEALRERRGKGVGDRRLRDVLLDHAAVIVQAEGREHRVPLRLVVGLMRMGFLGDAPVRVMLAGRRLGLAATYGAVWERDRGLPIL